MFSHAVALPPKHKIKATECGGAHIGDDFRTLWGSVDCPKCLAKRPRHPSISEPTRGRTCAESAWRYSPPVACAGAVTSTAWWGSLATDPRTNRGSTSRYQRAGRGSANSGDRGDGAAWDWAERSTPPSWQRFLRSSVRTWSPPGSSQPSDHPGGDERDPASQRDVSAEGLDSRGDASVAIVSTLQLGRRVLEGNAGKSNVVCEAGGHDENSHREQDERHSFRGPSHRGPCWNLAEGNRPRKTVTTVWQDCVMQAVGGGK